MRDEALADVGQVLVTEISRSGRLSEEFSWMIAKEKAFQIQKIIKLHISMYGELTQSKVNYKQVSKSVTRLRAWDCVGLRG